MNITLVSYQLATTALPRSFSVRLMVLTRQLGTHPPPVTGLGWSFPCDAFSLGCILVEFYTGVALFQTHDNLEHLAMMEQVMGKMPERFARSGARAKPEYFKEGSKLDWPKPKATRQSKKEVRACRSLQVCATIPRRLSHDADSCRVFRRSFPLQTLSTARSWTLSSGFSPSTPPRGSPSRRPSTTPTFHSKPLTNTERSLCFPPVYLSVPPMVPVSAR